MLMNSFFNIFYLNNVTCDASHGAVGSWFDKAKVIFNFKKRFKNIQNLQNHKKSNKNPNLSTIVVDLDHTLIQTVAQHAHTARKPDFILPTSQRKCFIRPYARAFLQKLKQLNLNVIIYTAGTKQYADELLDKLDIANCVDKVYARENGCVAVNGVYRKFARSVCKTDNFVIVDDSKVYANNENDFVFKIKKFTQHTQRDTELLSIYKSILLILSGQKNKQKAVHIYNKAQSF